MKAYGLLTLALSLCPTLALASPPQLRLIESAPWFVKTMAAENPAAVHPVSSNLMLVSDEAIMTLSVRAHELTGRCGGFIDITNESEQATIMPMDRNRMSDETEWPRLDGKKQPIVDAINDARPENIEAFDKLYSGHFKNRYAKSDEGVTAPAWLRDQWQQMAEQAGRKDVVVELVDPPKGYRQPSVRITIPGSNSGAPIIVLGGHLDSINRKGGEDAPGADDDGSGIAALTEAYRLMLAHGFHPKTTVQIFGYAAEELGLLGSRAIAERYQARGIQVRAAFQLDMVSYPGESKAVTFIMDNVDQGLTLWTQQLYGLYLGGEIKEERCGYGCSDHASWHRYGYASVFPFESPMSEMNHRIHTPDDLWDSKLDATYSVQFSQLAYAFAAEMAN